MAAFFKPRLGRSAGATDQKKPNKFFCGSPYSACKEQHRQVAKIQQKTGRNKPGDAYLRLTRSGAFLPRFAGGRSAWSLRMAVCVGLCELLKA
jgi:hypothetical protein